MMMWDGYEDSGVMMALKIFNFGLSDFWIFFCMEWRFIHKGTRYGNHAL
jgi:hypothetical protein